MSGGAFFLVYFLDGWVMGLDRMRIKTMTVDIHTVGYLMIAPVYIVFAIIK